jgi:hypothetical protein
MFARPCSVTARLFTAYFQILLSVAAFASTVVSLTQS